VAVKTPVDGLNLSLVDDTLIGKFPVVVVTQDKYISAAVLVSSVIATLVALVAVVAVVAELALPVKAPTKVVEVTEVSPAMVVAKLPKLIAVEPIVTLELTKAEFGIEVKLAPDPLNPVAVKTPVEGLNWYFVELVYSVVKLPLVALANNG